MSGSCKLNPKTFKSRCRTCLKMRDLVAMDEVRWKNGALKKVLSNWISFENQYENKMPQKICKACLNWCYNIQNFSEQVKQSEERLKNVLIEEYEVDESKVKPEIIILLKDEEVKKHYDDFMTQEIENDEGKLEEFPKLDLDKENENNFEEIDRSEEFEDNNVETDHKIDNESERFPYTCRPCGQGFNEYNDLLKHKELLKHKGVAFYCVYCGKQNFGRTQDKFETHLRTHTKEKPFACYLCDKTFSDKSCLARHTKTQHSKASVVEYSCKSCNSAFTRRDNLLKHEKKCVQIARRKAEIRRKKPIARGKEAPTGKFQCSICGKMYSKFLIDDHVKEHEQNSAAPCDVCGKEFASTKKMLFHRKFVHSIGKYTCEICGITVKQKTYLTMHIMKAHQGIKSSFNCEYCKKVFRNKLWFRQHMRIHTNDTKYQCNVCLKICVNKRKLEQHTRVHTGERRYECEQCGKKFAAKENLNLHVKAHNGPPTHQCAQCPKAFYMNCYLQRHIRQVHERNDLTAQENTKKETKNEIHNNSEQEDSDDELNRFLFLKNIFKNVPT